MTISSLVPKKAIYVGLTIAVILIAVVATLSFYFQKPTSGSSTPKAAIIDQLSSSDLTASSRYPNQTFIDTTTALLLTHFPEVDYYSDNATVENYKNLPSEGYKLIIWRAHSAIDINSGYIAICTSDIDDAGNYQRYFDYYSTGKLTLCNITDDPMLYFAITPEFIEEVMNGRFSDTVIILMSCNGLEEGYTKTAEALEEKGAKAIISWDYWIQAPNNDEATALLLNYLINENYTIQQAVAKIPPQQSPAGPTQMTFYPTSAGDYFIPNYNERAAISNAWSSRMPTFRNVDAEGSNRANYEPEVDSAKLLDVSIALKQSRIAGYEELHQQD
jgi:hypothetical protein